MKKINELWHKFLDKTEEDLGFRFAVTLFACLCVFLLASVLPI